jgi:hypothetical protein
MIFNGANQHPPALARDESSPSAPRRTKLKPSMFDADLLTLLPKALKSIYNRLIPFGYEDETGFHYGKR